MKMYIVLFKMRLDQLCSKGAQLTLHLKLSQGKQLQHKIALPRKRSLSKQANIWACINKRWGKRKQKNEEKSLKYKCSKLVSDQIQSPVVYVHDILLVSQVQGSESKYEQWLAIMIVCSLHYLLRQQVTRLVKAKEIPTKILWIVFHKLQILYTGKLQLFIYFYFI